LIEIDKRCLHEHACEIFSPHCELEWPSYGLPNMGNWASSDFGVFSVIRRRDVIAEHALKRSCVVVHCLI